MESLGGFVIAGGALMTVFTPEPASFYYWCISSPGCLPWNQITVLWMVPFIDPLLRELLKQSMCQNKSNNGNN